MSHNVTRNLSQKNQSQPGPRPFGVLCFPGTQCDQDVVSALNQQGVLSKKLSYRDRITIKDYSSFILPGGFSYGDYLRAGALAAHSPAMQDIQSAANRGWPILGICNGFQILCEVGLLEGVLLQNHSVRFVDEWSELKLLNPCPSWGGGLVRKKAFIPIAHSQGAFYCSKEQLKKLQDKEQIWWTYVKNPNGSVANIAGVMNAKKNVAGLMPHPERAMAQWMGGTDGRSFFNPLPLY